MSQLDIKKCNVDLFRLWCHLIIVRFEYDLHAFLSGFGFLGWRASFSPNPYCRRFRPPSSLASLVELVRSGHQ
jgi:hypothetical protein